MSQTEFYPPWTRKGRENPVPWYNHMREHHPVVYHDEITAYGVFRYSDAKAVFADNENWSVQRRFDALPEDQRGLHILANTLNGVDPPDHARLRNLAMPAVAPAQIDKHANMVRDTAARLFDQLLPKGQFDFANEFAHPMVQMVINTVMGIPPEDYHLSKDLSDRQEACGGRYTGGTFSDPEGLRKVNQEYRDYFQPIIEARRHHDHGDVMSKLVQAEIQGDRLSSEELFKMAMIFNRGGADTTMTGLTHMIRALMEFPEQCQRIRADPGLIPTAVEETLRFYPPSHSMSRVAVNDVEIDGVLIPKGATVLLWLPAANRDPAVFNNPDSFDVARKPNGHLSLGHGIHMCIGMHLARLEMRVVLEQWLERVADFQRTEQGPIEFSQNSLVTIVPQSFPVRVESIK